MLFSWKKNRVKEKIFHNKNNDDLLVELREKGITDKNILNSIKKVPRELFVNEISIQWAYENVPLPIDCEQTISQPYVVAFMIDCLKLKKTNKMRTAKTLHNVKAYHTPSSLVGKIAKLTRCKKLVLTHFVPTKFK